MRSIFFRAWSSELLAIVILASLSVPLSAEITLSLSDDSPEANSTLSQMIPPARPAIAQVSATTLAQDVIDSADSAVTQPAQIPLTTTPVWNGNSVVPPIGTWWAEFDMLFWWSQGNSVPPLVTTSAPGTIRDEAGVLGFPATDVLFGGDRINNEMWTGGRMTFGHWFDPGRTNGVEFHFMGLGGDDEQFFRRGIGGFPILARPFFNTLLNQEDSQLVSYPLVVDGTVSVETSSEMYSAGVLWRKTYYSNSSCYIDFVGGYRYLGFRERLQVDENLITREPGFVPLGTTLDVRDTFVTETHFHGGDMGIVAEVIRGSHSLSVATKLAVGGVVQRSLVKGSTTVETPSNPPFTSPGGLLAQQSNMGEQETTDFAMVPELDVNLNLQLTTCFSISAGYTLLFLTEVLRTGDQIDLRVDPAQLAQNGGGGGGAAWPAKRFKTTSMWTQGLNLRALLEF